MQLETHTDADLLEVRATGQFSLDEAKQTFLEIINAVARHGTKRVLFDGRTITGNPETIERFYYGEFAAAAAVQHKHQSRSGDTRFAYVLTEPVLDPERFGETVAVNRGMLVKAFDDVEEARAWLETAPTNNPGDHRSPEPRQ